MIFLLKLNRHIIMLLVVMTPLLILGTTTHARNSSDLLWKEVRSPRFRILFHEPNIQLAQQYANASELALDQLQPFFSEELDYPITVLLTDHTDLSNGSATFFPYPMITAYPVLPLPRDTISDFQNWAYELMLHELVHLLTFQPVHGFYKPLRYLFGSVITPNALLPRWYLEGVAVELESRLTSHGRIRSAKTRAQLQALIQDNRLQLETVDQINESGLDRWPQGNRPYLFGSIFIHNLIEGSSTSEIDLLNQRWSRRLPFLLNGVFTERFGSNVEESWLKIQAQLLNASKKDLSNNTSQFQKVQQSNRDSCPTLNGVSISTPSFSPDGKQVAYQVSSARSSSQIYIQKKSAETSEFKICPAMAEMKFKTSGTTSLTWSPDSSVLLFDQLSLFKRFNLYRDLFIIKFEENARPIRLTRGERVVQPSFGPSGSDVIYTRNRGGRQELVLFHLASKKKKILYQAQLGITLSSPHFWGHDQVVFVGRTATGIDKVFLSPLDRFKPKVISNHFSNVSCLLPVPNGLLACGEKNKIKNLYLFNKITDPPQQLTMTSTEIIDVSYDPRTNQVYAVELGSQGGQLLKINLESKPTYEDPLPDISILDYKTPKPAPVTIPENSYLLTDYSPLSYLIPRYWVPFVFPVEGGITFQGITSSQDPVGKHFISIFGSFDTFSNLPSGGLRYVNSTTALDIGFQGSLANEWLGSSNSILTSKNISVDSSGFIYNLSNAWRFFISHSYLESELPNSNGTTILKRSGPAGGISYNSRAASPIARDFTFQSQLGITSYLPLNDWIHYQKINFNFASSVQLPWSSGHSLQWTHRSSFAPQLSPNKIISIGDRTIGGNYLVSLVNSQNLLRGYPSASLVGRSLVSQSLEYGFPIWNIDQGWGTFPLFLRKLNLNFFTDGTAIDGAYYDTNLAGYYRDEWSRVYGSAGVEWILQSTAGYHLPLSLTFGIYQGFNEAAGGSLTYFMSLGYAGHGGLDDSHASSNRLRPSSFAR